MWLDDCHMAYYCSNNKVVKGFGRLIRLLINGASPIQQPLKLSMATGSVKNNNRIKSIFGVGHNYLGIVYHNFMDLITSYFKQKVSSISKLLKWVLKLI